MDKNKRADISGRLYLSTVAEDAAETARAWGLGLEIAEFCTAANMDADFPDWDGAVRDKIEGVRRVMMHAPFNELCPAAIDPLVLEIAERRYRQACALAGDYGVTRLVVHSGYVPLVYFKEYFARRSIDFWRRFLGDRPEGPTLLLENVLEDEPQMLIDIVRGVDHPRLQLCLDLGHANIMADGITVEEWTAAVLPYIGHVHLHNNDGWPDRHGALGDGSMDMEGLLARITAARPEVTLTVESIESAPSVRWLREKGFLGESA